MPAPLYTQLSGASANKNGQPKRLIVCCDGTWQDSLGARDQEPPSNVTRISRVLCRTCSDGTHQVISYHAGVGTANSLDRFTGGTFGMGLDQDIREVYNFICTNYVDGDDIILIGFSRGAFTARSVADMIASVGLLTPDGLDYFYEIFEDYENIGSTSRPVEEFLVGDLEKYDGSVGTKKGEWEARRMERYKNALKERGFTRDTYQDGSTVIKIKALAVWDTVGTLGIPPAPVIGVDNAFQAIALDEPRYAFRPSLWERAPGSTTRLKQVWFPGSHSNVGGGWEDQQIADITLAWMADQLSSLGVEFNFKRMMHTFTETLRFSAAHPFPYVPILSPSFSSLKSLVTRPVRSLLPSKSTSPLPWACSPIYHSPFNTSKDSSSPNGGTPTSSSDSDSLKSKTKHKKVKRSPGPCTLRTTSSCSAPHPEPSLPPATLFTTYGARPWSLGQIRRPTSVMTTMAGTTIRRPGRTLRVDETTNEDTDEPLLNTGERIHSSVRVRLACQGLSVDDESLWACEALLGAGWVLERGRVSDSSATVWEPGEEEYVAKCLRDGPREVTDLAWCGEYPSNGVYPVKEGDREWKWVWKGKVKGKNGEEEMQVPQELELPEEPLCGYWERVLLGLMCGEVDVWRWALGA